MLHAVGCTQAVQSNDITAYRPRKKPRTTANESLGACMTPHRTIDFYTFETFYIMSLCENSKITKVCSGGRLFGAIKLSPELPPRPTNYHQLQQSQHPNHMLNPLCFQMYRQEHPLNWLFQPSPCGRSPCRSPVGNRGEPRAFCPPCSPSRLGIEIQG